MDKKVQKATLAMTVFGLAATSVIAPHGVSAAGANFKDVKNHWAKEAITRAVSDSYVKGYSDGTFKPDGTVTRAELASLLVRISNNPATGTIAQFSDMNGHWAAGSVSAVSAMGFIDQSALGSKFDPGKAMTRYEVAEWLSNGLAASNPEYAQAESELQNTVIPVQEFFKGSLGDKKATVGLMVGTGIMGGDSRGTFSGNDPVTRAELVTLLYRYKDVEGKAPTSFLGLNEMREVGRTGTNMVTIGKATYVEGSKRFEDVRETPVNVGIGNLIPHYYIVLDTYKPVPQSIYYKVFDRGRGAEAGGYTVVTKVTFTPNRPINSLQSYSNAMPSVTGSSMIRMKATTTYGAEGLENTFGPREKYKSVSEYMKAGVARTFWNSTGTPFGRFVDIGKIVSFKLDK